jgi:hypothetical protein
MEATRNPALSGVPVSKETLGIGHAAGLWHDTAGPRDLSDDALQILGAALGHIYQHLPV